MRKTIFLNYVTSFVCFKYDDFCKLIVWDNYDIDFICMILKSDSRNSKSNINMRETLHVSIITAAYNVEEYLKDCLDSILDQTFSDFELILIDDGSTDKTGQICDMYAAKDKRIRVIHQSNVGVSDAWNRGIELVQGEYVGFVDSDDIIHPQMYELLYKAITETDSDIAYCNYQKFSGDKINAVFESRTDYNLSKSSIETELMKIALTNSGTTEVIWKGLYRYECVKDLRFVSGMSWQDRMWSPCAILNAEKIVRIDRILYFWRQRQGSISHEGAVKHYCNGLYVGCRLLEYLQQNNPEWFPLFALRIYSDALLLHGWMQESKDIESRTVCEKRINDTLGYFEKLSVSDILTESHTKFPRKLFALTGKISFPLAGWIKKTLLTMYIR